MKFTLLFTLSALCIQIPPFAEGLRAEESQGAALPKASAAPQDEMFAALEERYLDLTVELREVFRDFILQFPPMSMAETNLLHAEYMEINLDLYAEREELRYQMILARRDRPFFREDLRASERDARQQVQARIVELRAMAESKIHTGSYEDQD